MKIRRLDHVAIPVTDIKRSVQWYQDVLGLERRYEKEWGDYPAMLCAGEDTCVALIYPPNTPPNEGWEKKDRDPDRHLAFNIAIEDFDEALGEIRSRGIPYTYDDHGISLSIYFFDPDGNWIEITTFDLPPGRPAGQDRPS